MIRGAASPRFVARRQPRCDSPIRRATREPAGVKEEAQRNVPVACYRGSSSRPRLVERMCGPRRHPFPDFRPGTGRLRQDEHRDCDSLDMTFTSRGVQMSPHMPEPVGLFFPP
jgi:hypothetical protein